MRTGLKIWGVSAGFISFMLFSCSHGTVETEMEDWCACQQEAKTNPSKKTECAEMMTDIARKYEFDPEAVVEIQTKVLECKQ